MTAHPSTLCLVGGLLLGALLLAPPAAAHGCYLCGEWLPVGINAGAATHFGDGTGLQLGGEVSYLPIHDDLGKLTVGAYADFLRDFHSDTWRASAGPEVILAPFVAFDAGPVVEFGGGGEHLGGRLRYFATLPFLIPYVGVTLLNRDAHPTTLEAGLLAKFPFQL